MPIDDPSAHSNTWPRSGAAPPRTCREPRDALMREIKGDICEAEKEVIIPLLEKFLAGFRIQSAHV